MATNIDLQRYGINIPSIIRPEQAAGYGGIGVPAQSRMEMQEVSPKMYMQQKWFRTYEEMIKWRSQNAVSDAKMVRMKKPYRGYNYQLHYNKRGVTSKSRGIVE